MRIMTQREEIEIRALRRAAAEARDEAQVLICDRALRGDAEAILECARVIEDARAEAEYQSTRPGAGDLVDLLLTSAGEEE